MGDDYVVKMHRRTVAVYWTNAHSTAGLPFHMRTDDTVLPTITAFVTDYITQYPTDTIHIPAPPLNLPKLPPPIDLLDYRWHTTKTLREISDIEHSALMSRLVAAERASLANARTARSATPAQCRPVDRIPRWMGHVKHK